MSPSSSDSRPEPPEGDELLPNSAADDFFNKIKSDFRRPKPSEEAVAAALQAIQTLAADAAAETTSEVSEHSDREPAGGNPGQCHKCGGLNSETNRFCGYCGTLLDRVARPAKAAISSGLAQEQHVYHHHHHYHHFPDGGVHTAGASAVPDAPALEPADLAAAQSDLRKLVQDWTLAYNSNRLDDIAALYSSEAIVLRSNMLPVRGRSGVREHLASASESGLGDLNLDCTDIGMLGEIACLSGRSRMLMPVAAANRQERTGKFLLVVHREGGEWKILADVWCMDASPAPSPARPPRKISRLDP